MSDDVATKDQMEAGPSRPVLDPDDPRTQLREGVKAALQALPGEFNHPHPISGVNATDLFSLNSFLGSGIELEVSPMTPGPVGIPFYGEGEET